MASNRNALACANGLIYRRKGFAATKSSGENPKTLKTKKEKRKEKKILHNKVLIYRK
jgi:hypothetical protein